MSLRVNGPKVIQQIRLLFDDWEFHIVRGILDPFHFNEGWLLVFINVLTHLSFKKLLHNRNFLL